jgi:hypothetical protein
MWELRIAAVSRNCCQQKWAGLQAQVRVLKESYLIAAAYRNCSAWHLKFHDNLVVSPSETPSK